MRSSLLSSFVLRRCRCWPRHAAAARRLSGLRRTKTTCVSVTAWHPNFDSGVVQWLSFSDDECLNPNHVTQIISIADRSNWPRNVNRLRWLTLTLRPIKLNDNSQSLVSCFCNFCFHERLKALRTDTTLADFTKCSCVFLLEILTVFGNLVSEVLLVTMEKTFFRPSILVRR